jgi:predicted RNase H-like HicB family nuclease
VDAPLTGGKTDMKRHFTVSDGELVLFLWPAEEGGYTITSPMDERLISEAETLEEAFAMGHDAMKLLQDVDRRKQRRSSRRGKKALRSGASQAS